MIVFGPIPSRRLGRSLGINNIPFKHCTYSCVYCQLGPTNPMTNIVRNFFNPKEIFNEVKTKIKNLMLAGEKVDYITFVPDGEPTLDINLCNEILYLKTLEIKTAVITNASLLWDEKVRSDLMNADWVSVKIDTVDEEIWHKINRPYRKLQLQEILSGIKMFAASFTGELVTETMLVKGINDTVRDIKKTARFIEETNPDKSFILIPNRPPTEENIKSPTEETLNKVYQIFYRLIKNTEILTYNEGTDFTFLSEVEKELLSILAVHPMRKDAVERFLVRSSNDWGIIERLLSDKKIKEVYYNHNTYFINMN